MDSCNLYLRNARYGKHGGGGYLLVLTAQGHNQVCFKMIVIAISFIFTNIYLPTWERLERIELKNSGALIQSRIFSSFFDVAK